MTQQRVRDLPETAILFVYNDDQGAFCRVRWPRPPCSPSLGGVVHLVALPDPEVSFDEQPVVMQAVWRGSFRLLPEVDGVRRLPANCFVRHGHVFRIDKAYPRPTPPPRTGIRLLDL